MTIGVIVICCVALAAWAYTRQPQGRRHLDDEPSIRVKDELAIRAAGAVLQARSAHDELGELLATHGLTYGDSDFSAWPPDAQAALKEWTARVADAVTAMAELHRIELAKLSVAGRETFELQVIEWVFGQRPQFFPGSRVEGARPGARDSNP